LSVESLASNVWWQVVPGLLLRVAGLAFRVQDLGVWGLGIKSRVQGLGSKFQGLWLKIRFWVSGLGFRVWGCGLKFEG